MRWGLLGLLLSGCEGGARTTETRAHETRTTDTRSATMASAEQRISFLNGYVASPSPPLDVEFHVVFHDNSGGLLAGPSDMDITAAVRVKPGDAPTWALGCTRAPLDVPPDWVEPLLEGKSGWEVDSQPDTLRCGLERRVIHVREGIIFRRIATERN